jgi:hypothetical protein
MARGDCYYRDPGFVALTSLEQSEGEGAETARKQSAANSLAFEFHAS